MKFGRAGWAAASVVMIAPVAAAAASVPLDLAAGTVGQQIIAICRTARASVAVPDPVLWKRRVPALRGNLPIAEALARIADSAGAQLITAGPNSWRLVARQKRQPPSPQYARSAPLPPEPEPELVVTASKRDVPAHQVAAQVQRVTGAELELGGASGTDRLTSRLTSIASTYLGAGRNKLFIRGIADSSFTGPTQATVGQYYGDLRLGYNAPDPDLRLSDLAAVEVLEGPQGTLYGAGALGGIIRLIPNAPDAADTSIKVALGGSLSDHGTSSGDAQLVANVPVISDRVAIRLVGNVATEGGYIDKPKLGETNVNRTRIVGGRATVGIDLGAGWNAELIGLGQRIRGADGQYADRPGPPLTSSAAVVEGFGADFRQGQFVLDGTIGGAHFRSSTGITAHDLMERYDATVPDGPIRLFTQGNRTRTEANETRLWTAQPDGSGWLAGLSLIHNRTQLTRRYVDIDGVQPATGVVNGVTEGTLYGEGSLRLLPGILATAGLRVTHSRLSGEGEDVQPTFAAFLRGVTAERSQTRLLPSASAVIDVTPDAQLILRYQQGFRPGGLAIESGFIRRFQSDRVATVEAAARYGRKDRDPFDLALTVAHTSWLNIQADFIDGSGLPSTANIGDGELWTIEGSVGARLIDAVRVEGGFSFNDSRIEEPSLVQTFALLGSSALSTEAARFEIATRLRQIPNIARFTARAGVTYDSQLTDDAKLTVDAWLRYVGSSRLGVGPVLGQLQGSYLDTGLSGRVQLAAAGLTASVTNITDARGNRFALGTPFPTGRDQTTPLRPRTIRIGLDFAL